MRNTIYLLLAIGAVVALATVTIPVSFAKGTDGYVAIARGSDTYVKVAQVKKKGCPKGTRWDLRQRVCAPTG